MRAGNTKVGLSVSAWMIRRSGNGFIRQLKGLHSGTRFENFEGTNPKAIVDAMLEVIREQFHRVESMEGSGWMLESFDHVMLAFSEIPAIVGSSYKPLPTELELRRENGIVNVKNLDDDQCFKWAVTRYLNPIARKRDSEKLTPKLRGQSEKLDWTCTSFPTPLHELDIFENMNKISVMVLVGTTMKKKQHTFDNRIPGTKRMCNYSIITGIIAQLKICRH